MTNGVTYYKNLEINDFKDTYKILYHNDKIILINRKKPYRGPDGIRYIKKIFPGSTQNRDVFCRYFGLNNREKVN